MLNESKVMQTIKQKQMKKQKGATMIEYALVVAGVAAIAAVIFATDGPVGTAITDTITNAVSGTGTGSGT